MLFRPVILTALGCFSQGASSRASPHQRNGRAIISSRGSGVRPVRSFGFVLERFWVCFWPREVVDPCALLPYHRRRRLAACSTSTIHRRQGSLLPLPLAVLCTPKRQRGGGGGGGFGSYRQQSWAKCVALSSDRIIQLSLFPRHNRQAAGHAVANHIRAL